MNKYTDMPKKMIFLYLMLSMTTTTIAAAASLMAKPECREKCGNVSIPYPFGTTQGCSLDERYLLSCNETTIPPILSFSPKHSHIVLEVLDISVGGELRVLMNVVKKCYDRFGNVTTNITSGHLKSFYFPFSVTRNMFVGIGCDTRATLHSNDTQTSCDSYCNKLDIVTNGYCQINMPKDPLTYFSLFKFANHNKTLWRSNPCDHAFVIERTLFNFSEAYLHTFTTRVPLVLDWAVSTNETCKDAMRNSWSYVCQNNSHCYDSDNGPGYRCKCSTGYKGNPYLTNGCQDIDECADPKLNNCAKKCMNTLGSFTCSCPKGESGDGIKDGKGCVAKQSMAVVINLTVGFGVSLIVFVICGSWLYMELKKRRLIQLKHKFFMQNGGLMLQQQLSKFHGYNETAKIFTAQELEKATDKYHYSKIVGQGGYGTVYKGILDDDRVVAIKKSKLMDQSKIEPFINEVVVLSRINHRNVVRLLGCCLETEVPLLVYEFVSNGTLFDHIHDQTNASAMSWDTRIKIAAETAGVLSYLHSAASVPIIHRDIKSTNILLDDNYIAKVSDFGNSRLIPVDQTDLTTLVQGTLGYLDPEYFLTSELTEKSDVYSFGVLLAELITGKKALCFKRPEAERNLANYFLVALKKGCLFEVVGDYNMLNSDEIEEVAALAKRCLRVKGEERPSMKEVATALERLIMTNHTMRDVHAGY